MRHCTGSKYQLDRSHLKQENIDFKIASKILILKYVGSTVANEYAIYACHLRTVEESDEVCMCVCVFLCVFVCVCVCVFEDGSFLGERVVGWGGATVGQQKAPPLPERERERGRERDRYQIHR